MSERELDPKDVLTDLFEEELLADPYTPHAASAASAAAGSSLMLSV